MSNRNLSPTVAGNGKKGVPADGNQATKSPLVDPRAVAVDSKNNIYILERSGHALRMVTPDGKIRTVAGTASTVPMFRISDVRVTRRILLVLLNRAWERNRPYFADKE